MLLLVLFPLYSVGPLQFGVAGCGALPGAGAAAADGAPALGCRRDRATPCGRYGKSRGGARVAMTGAVRSSGAAAATLVASAASSLSHYVRNLKLAFAVLVGGGVWSTAQGAMRGTLVTFWWCFKATVPAPRSAGVRADIRAVTDVATVVANFRVSAKERASNNACSAVDVTWYLHSLEKYCHGCGVLDSLHLQGVGVAFRDDQFSELGVVELEVNASDYAFAGIIGWGRVYCDPIRSIFHANLLHCGVCSCVTFAGCADDEDILSYVGADGVFREILRSQGCRHCQGLLNLHWCGFRHVETVSGSHDDTERVPR